MFHLQAGGCKRRPNLACYGCMFAFVLFHLVFLYQVKKLAGKNISEMTYVVSGGMQNLNQSIQVILHYNCLKWPKYSVIKLQGLLWQWN